MNNIIILFALIFTNPLFASDNFLTAKVQSVFSVGITSWTVYIQDLQTIIVDQKDGEESNTFTLDLKKSLSYNLEGKEFTGRMYGSKQLIPIPKYMSDDFEVPIYTIPISTENQSQYTSIPITLNNFVLKNFKKTIIDLCISRDKKDDDLSIEQFNFPINIGPREETARNKITDEILTPKSTDRVVFTLEYKKNVSSILHIKNVSIDCSDINLK